MKRIVFTALVVLLGGCVTTRQSPPPPVGQLGTLDICYALVTGRTGDYGHYLLDSELRTRGEDCNKYKDMMSIRVQADAQRVQADAQRSAALISASQLFLRPMQPQPTPMLIPTPPPRTQINCTSTRIGMFTNTQCN